jgi:hypothetical protein
MRKLAVLCVLFAALPAPAQPQPPPAPDWKDWAGITGTWEADAGGPAAGGYVLAPELGGRVLVRHSHADRPGGPRHEDFTIIYRDGAATRADFWDNEGHVIHYGVTVDAGKSYTFVSDAAAGQPRFRLTYTVTGPKSLALRFEIAPPGSPEQWKPYIDAKLHRA